MKTLTRLQMFAFLLLSELKDTEFTNEDIIEMINSNVVNQIIDVVVKSEIEELDDLSIEIIKSKALTLLTFDEVDEVYELKRFKRRENDNIDTLLNIDTILWQNSEERAFLNSKKGTSLTDFYRERQTDIEQLTKKVREV